MPSNDPIYNVVLAEGVNWRKTPLLCDPVPKLKSDLPDLPMRLFAHSPVCESTASSLASKAAF